MRLGLWLTTMYVIKTCDLPANLMTYWRGTSFSCLPCVPWISEGSHFFFFFFKIHVYLAGIRKSVYKCDATFTFSVITSSCYDRQVVMLNHYYWYHVSNFVCRYVMLQGRSVLYQYIVYPCIITVCMYHNLCFSRYL